MWTNIESHVKLDEMLVQGDELLFKSLFLKDNAIVNATVTLSLFFFHYIFRFPSYGGSFTLYSFLLDHLDRTLVSHLNLHSSTCPIRHLPWLFVNVSGWDYTVQGSFPHKCGQKSCCSALNAVVTAFLLDIFAFLSSPYTPKVHPYRWNFLEDRLGCPSTC